MNRPAGVWAWPQFDEPDLEARFVMPETDFQDLWLDLMNQMPPRDYSAEAFETAVGYPWPRPDGSFVLSEGEGRLLADLEREVRTAIIAELTGPASGRTPMLAIGSNASPEGLWRKFAHFKRPEDRTLLAITGRLHEFDVGASAELALYGALPATLFSSPGTRVDATALWLTETQLTQLAWAEIPYWIGRLEARFEFEPLLAAEGAGGFERALVFVNRFGAFAPDGHPLALAAIPAEARTVPAMGQEQLLGLTAEMTFGTGISAEDLVRLAFEEPADTGPRVAEAMRSNSIPFESDRWTPFPG